MSDAPCGLGTSAMETGHGWEAARCGMLICPKYLRRASTLTTTVMAEKYELTALPLPQNWQTAVGQEYTDAFLAELKSSQ